MKTLFIERTDEDKFEVFNGVNGETLKEFNSFEDAHKYLIEKDFKERFKTKGDILV